ncbi:MAG TPA: Uma2 family endonuclease [Terriglobia bacterium]|jgi:Uma2 family endonuclease
MSIQDHPTTEILVTGDQLLTMGDVGPCELVEGRVVRMSPTGAEHGGCELNFGELIQRFVRQHKLGKVMVGEVGIYIRRSPDTVRAADVLFISHERLAQRKNLRGYLDVAPELIVEIMSPDDRWVDIDEKLRDYFSIGVRLVWVANPIRKVVYAYRSLTDVREFTLADSLPGDAILSGFSISVAQVFEE